MQFLFDNHNYEDRRTYLQKIRVTSQYHSVSDVYVLKVHFVCSQCWLQFWSYLKRRLDNQRELATLYIEDPRNVSFQPIFWDQPHQQDVWWCLATLEQHLPGQQLLQPLLEQHHPQQQQQNEDIMEQEIKNIEQDNDNNVVDDTSD
jgi:hypothetical protein